VAHRRVQFEHQIIPSLYLSGDFVDYFRVDERRMAFYLATFPGMARRRRSSPCC
jgi:serine phosphatase RsbU (regulator of sigma subunit)